MDPWREACAGRSVWRQHPVHHAVDARASAMPLPARGLRLPVAAPPVLRRDADMPDDLTMRGADGAGLPARGMSHVSKAARGVSVCARAEESVIPRRSHARPFIPSSVGAGMGPGAAGAASRTLPSRAAHMVRAKCAGVPTARNSSMTRRPGLRSLLWSSHVGMCATWVSSCPSHPSRTPPGTGTGAQEPDELSPTITCPDTGWAQAFCMAGCCARDVCHGEPAIPPPLRPSESPPSSPPPGT